MAVEPVLGRALVCAGGRARADFAGGGALVLEPGGGSFAALAPRGGAGAGAGAVERGLSACAVRRHRGRLGLALAFVNAHTDVPYWCSALEVPAPQCGGASPPATAGVPAADGGAAGGEGGPAKFATAAPLVEVRFSRPFVRREAPADAGSDPLTSTSTASPGHAELQVYADGSVALTSDFRHCRVVLGAHCLRVAVTYPLLVGRGRAEAGEGAEETWNYVWHRQAFSASDPPPRWAGVVEALREAAGDAGGGLEDERGPSLSAPDLKVALPVARRECAPRWSEFGEGSWWRDPSAALFPPDEAVVLEWTPEALFHCIPGTDGGPEVEVVLGSDGSVIRSFQGGRFFRHALLGPEGAVERVYSAVLPLQGLQAPPTGTFARLDAVLAHAQALLLHHRRLRGGHADGPRPSPVTGDRRSGALVVGGGGEGDKAAAVLSNEVREDCEVEGVGRFVAFVDGRVWATFADRTLARLDRWHRLCRFVLPDGAAVEVRPAAPVGVEHYMAFVSEFAVWAFRSPGERAAALETQAAVEACANRAGQMARLLRWEISHELPEKRPSALLRETPAPAPTPPAPWLEPEGETPAPLRDGEPAGGFTREDVRSLLERNESLLARLSEGGLLAATCV